jgi:hypothetical protein
MGVDVQACPLSYSQVKSVLDAQTVEHCLPKRYSECEETDEVTGLHDVLLEYIRCDPKCNADYLWFAFPKSLDSVVEVRLHIRSILQQNIDRLSVSLEARSGRRTSDVLITSEILSNKGDLPLPRQS